MCHESQGKTQQNSIGKDKCCLGHEQLYLHECASVLSSYRMHSIFLRMNVPLKMWKPLAERIFNLGGSSSTNIFPYGKSYIAVCCSFVNL